LGQIFAGENMSQHKKQKKSSIFQKFQELFILSNWFVEHMIFQCILLCLVLV